MSQNTQSQVGYGLSQALINLAPKPIESQRAPTVADKAIPGTLWIDESAQNPYIIVAIENNQGIWQQLATSGSGTFSSINVTTGPNNIEGTTSINTSSTSDTSIGNSTGTVNIRGTINLNSDNNGNTVIGTIGGTSNNSLWGTFLVRGGDIVLGVINDVSSVTIDANSSISIGDLGTPSISIGNLFGSSTVINGPIQTTNLISVATNTSVTAGGAEYISLGSTGPGIFMGSGAPSLAAPQGSIYLRTDGSSTSTRFYIAENGTGTWTAVTTAA